MYDLSIVVPVFNEPTLPLIIEKLIQSTKDFDTEIIVVDDGSTDNTVFWLKENAAKFNLKTIFHAENLGKGAAIKSAFEILKGKVMIIQDADLEYNPDDIPKIVSPILNNELKVCYGSRYLDKSQLKATDKWVKRHWNQSLLAFWGSQLLTSICNFLFKVRLTDVFTCYKAIEVDLLKKINVRSNGFEVETEITVKLLKQTTIVEIPIHYNPRTYQEGKKIKWKDGIIALFTIFKYLK